MKEQINVPVDSVIAEVDVITMLNEQSTSIKKFSIHSCKSYEIQGVQDYFISVFFLCI